MKKKEEDNKETLYSLLIENNKEKIKKFLLMNGKKKSYCPICFYDHPVVQIVEVPKSKES